MHRHRQWLVLVLSWSTQVVVAWLLRWWSVRFLKPKGSYDASLCATNSLRSTTFSPSGSTMAIASAANNPMRWQLVALLLSPGGCSLLQPRPRRRWREGQARNHTFGQASKAWVEAGTRPMAAMEMQLHDDASKECRGTLKAVQIRGVWQHEVGHARRTTVEKWRDTDQTEACSKLSTGGGLRLWAVVMVVVDHDVKVGLKSMIFHEVHQ